MAAPGVRYQRQKARADLILSVLKQWDGLRDPKAGVVDWVALKLSCRRPKAQREIADAVAFYGAGRLKDDARDSEAVRLAIDLAKRVRVADPDPNLVKALDVVQRQPESSPPRQGPEMLAPAKVLAYLRQEEARLVQRLRNQLSGAAEDVQAALGRVADVDDACYLSTAPTATLAEAYRLAGELHQVRQILAMLKATEGFQ